MNRSLRAGSMVNFWLSIVAIGLILLGAGITLAILEKGIPAVIALVLAAGTLALGAWRLSGSTLRLTLSLVEQQSPEQMLVTRRPGQGLPKVAVFSGHMGVLIILKALRDSVGRLVAIPPPGSDFRTIAGLLRTSHSDVRVVSATAENAQLCARLENGEVMVGSLELEQPPPSPIEQLFLSSDGSTPAPTGAWPVSRELEDALTSSDLFIFGPGSFYTSVVPSLLVERIRSRVGSGEAPTVFVCSVMTEPGRTDGWTVTDFIRNFTEFAGFAPDYTIVNRSYPGSNMLNRYEVTGSYPIMVTPEEHMDSSKVVLGNQFPGSTSLNIGGSTVIEEDVIEVATETRLTLDADAGQASEYQVSVIRHDPEKLARVLRSILAQVRTKALAG